MRILKKIKKVFSKDDYIREGDKTLVTAVGILLFLGLLMLSSASSVVAYYKFGDSYYYLKHQLFGMGLGIVAFYAMSRIDYHIWKKYAVWFLVISVLLLLLVFIPGLSAHYGKARSWINIFGFSLQPSEFVKLSFLFYLAAWLERRKKSLHKLEEGIGPFIFILGFIGFLMFLQPDIGTLFIIFSISLIVFFVGGGKIKHLGFFMVILALGFALMVSVRPYQLNRFKCMADPSWSSGDICYQANQSLIAVGSGGFWGRGLGESRQKFMYLPEVSGDSIFAIIAEETGFIFSVILIGLYFFIFWRGFLIAKKAPDDFGRILAIGIVVWITLQAIINIGGMIGFMPMTGVPLPLVSYGGSAILAALGAVGVLFNISKYSNFR